MLTSLAATTYRRLCRLRRTSQTMASLDKALVSIITSLWYSPITRLFSRTRVLLPSSHVVWKSKFPTFSSFFPRARFLKS